MKLKCDEALSNFAFSFNLRRYNLETAVLPALTKIVAAKEKGGDYYSVGRCRLTL